MIILTDGQKSNFSWQICSLFCQVASGALEVTVEADPLKERMVQALHGGRYNLGRFVVTPCETNSQRENGSGFAWWEIQSRKVCGNTM